jgi:serine/threonine protein kinase
MRELNLLNSRVDGRYDVLNRLGRGSYAEIFTARDNFAPADSAHKVIVLKCLNVFLQDDLDIDLERTLIENFQNEAVALDRVRHPHIISRFGHGTARDLNGLIFHYLVLEYLAGGEVMKLCKTQPIPFSQAMNYIEQVCAGLGFAHRQNVIHRDLKPQNLLLTQNRQIVKIADFGVARTSLADSPITRVGTNIYAPPEHSPLTVAAEIVAGAPPVKLTPAADIYSLAKTIYVMISGESPRRFTNAPITALPEVISRQDWAGGILRVLQKATQTEARLRQQTVGEFWNDLAQIKFAAAQPDDIDEMPTQIAGKIFVPAIKKSADFISEVPQRASFSTSKENYNTSAEQPNSAKIIVPFGEKPAAPQPQNQISANQNANQFPLHQNLNQYSPPILNNNPLPQPNAYQPPTVADGQGQFQTDQREITGVPKKKKSKFLRRLIFSVLFLCMFAGILFATHNYLRNNGLLPFFSTSTQAKIFVKAAGANLRSEADRNDDSNILGVLAKDAELVIIRETDEWYFVRVVGQQSATSRPLQNGATGWIAKSVVTTR